MPDMKKFFHISQSTPCRKQYLSVCFLLLVGVMRFQIFAAVETAANGKPWNILFITMDDMNWDSMGAYGNLIPGITPHMDQLAAEGLRFEYAFNQTSSCVPSRNSYQTGRYPHTVGMYSFYNVQADFQILPQRLRDAGYFTACVNKPRDTSITDDYDLYWDYYQLMKGPEKRSSDFYAEHVRKALSQAKDAGAPFYCVVNIADPHKPLFNDPQSVKSGFDDFRPSTVFSVDDVTVPGFLPEHPEIRKELRNYYNSVKRGDDCVGAVLEALKQSGLEENTAVLFISDHGMPLPYAKSSLYPDGLRTPWVLRWPGRVSPGSVDSTHLISAIDFKPTVLDMVGVSTPDGVEGRSILPLLQGKTDASRTHIFAEFNDNAGGIPFPMRAIHTKQNAYIFNAWGTGENKFISASTWHLSEKVMKRESAKNPAIAERYQFLIYRTVEEYYDLERDPYCLQNLIDDPFSQAQISGMRKRMREWMVETDDYLLEAFDVKGDLGRLQEIYTHLDEEAIQRAETLQWKRYKNRVGGTGKNTELFRK